MRRSFILTTCLFATALPAFALDDDVVSAARAVLLQSAPGAQMYDPGNGQLRIYGATLGSGATAAESAELFLLDHSVALGVMMEDLEPGSRMSAVPLKYNPETATFEFLLLTYSQLSQGIPVFRSEVSVLVRNEPGYPVVWIGSSARNLTTPVAFPVTPAGPAQQAPEEGVQQRSGDRGWSIAVNNLPGMTVISDPEPVIWAGVDGQVVSPRRASVFMVDNGQQFSPNYQKFLYVVDAVTGATLYQENQILNTDVSGNVSGQATTGFAADACNPEALTAMKYAKVAIGATTAFADANGDFTIPNAGTAPVNVVSTVSGRYFNVINNGGSNASITLNVTPPGPANFVHNSANNTEAYRAQVNAYVQANVVRDHTLTYSPAYPVISTQTGFTANVMISSTCNAFYDGGSINFYSAGGGCNDTAFSTVVYHEYGHHLVQSGGSGQGAYGEGTGDCMGVIISDDPILAYGFSTGQCGSGIRNASNNKQYPCSGEIHDCGQLISGCVWETRNQLLLTNPGSYRDIISSLCVNAIPMHDGSNIDPSICIDYLTLDDNDGDLGNGTPHYAEINTGFSLHNMGVPVPLSCADITSVTGRCILGRAVQFTVTLNNSTHNGQTVTLNVDGVNRTLTINGNKAVFLLRRAEIGAHTATLTNPAGCANGTATTSCP